MSDDTDLSMRETLVAREAEWGRGVQPVRIAACADHAAAERTPVSDVIGTGHVTAVTVTNYQTGESWSESPRQPITEPSRMTYRTPGSTRDKSYWRQVWETVAACASFAGFGALFCWIWNR